MHEYYFSKPQFVHGNECDFKGRQKPGFLMRHVQNLSESQLSHYGADYHTIWNEGGFFAISKLAIHYLRRPKAEEDLILQTGSQGTRGARFLREFRLFSKEGEPITEIHTSYLLLDTKSHKILRPNAFGHSLPLIPEEERIPEFTAERFKAEGTVILHKTREIGYSDVDLNQHLNNTIYLDILMDCLPEEDLREKEPEWIYLDYHNEALLGDTLKCTVMAGNSGEVYVVAKRDEDICFSAKILWKEAR